MNESMCYIHTIEHYSVIKRDEGSLLYRITESKKVTWTLLEPPAQVSQGSQSCPIGSNQQSDGEIWPQYMPPVFPVVHEGHRFQLDWMIVLDWITQDIYPIKEIMLAFTHNCCYPFLKRELKHIDRWYMIQYEVWKYYANQRSKKSLL